jgi:hypothetical protein
MRVYLHSDRAEKTPKYPLTVSPAGDKGFLKSKGMHVLPEWVHPSGEPVQIELLFDYGSAEVPDALAKYMIERGIAHRGRMLRRIAQLFNAKGEPLNEVFDRHGAPVILDETAA